MQSYTLHYLTESTPYNKVHRCVSERSLNLLKDIIAKDVEWRYEAASD